MIGPSILLLHATPLLLAHTLIVVSTTVIGGLDGWLVAQLPKLTAEI